jgi:hypothetical protein
VSIADDLVDAFEPWWTPALIDYLRAIGSMFEEVELYALSGEDGEGWQILLDPDNAPAAALPYLAQYVGERLPVGISEAAARAWIKDAPNMRRGTLESVVRVAQRYLTGNGTVQVIERSGAGGASVDRLTVQTYVPETPDPDAVEEALLREVVPADIVLTYILAEGQTYGDIQAAHATYGAAATAYGTYAEAYAATPGWTFDNRPGLPT